MGIRVGLSCRAKNCQSYFDYLSWKVATSVWKFPYLRKWTTLVWFTTERIKQWDKSFLAIYWKTRSQWLSFLNHCWHNIEHTILIKNYFDLSNYEGMSLPKNPDRLGSDLSGASIVIAMKRVLWETTLIISSRGV